MWAMETLEIGDYLSTMNFTTTGNEFQENLTEQENSFDKSNGVVAIADWGFENYQYYMAQDLKEMPVKEIPEPNINYGILAFGIALRASQKAKGKSNL